MREKNELKNRLIFVYSLRMYYTLRLDDFAVSMEPYDRGGEAAPYTPVLLYWIDVLATKSWIGCALIGLF